MLFKDAPSRARRIVKKDDVIYIDYGTTINGSIKSSTIEEIFEIPESHHVWFVLRYNRSHSKHHAR